LFICGVLTVRGVSLGASAAPPLPQRKIVEAAARKRQ